VVEYISSGITVVDSWSLCAFGRKKYGVYYSIKRNRTSKSLRLEIQY